jgi:HD-like signal output (HDOD) protein/CheY-like chemotaxis protein
MRTRVLFVDDDPLIRAALERSCRRCAKHWEIAAATCATEALARMAERPFDVVVSDLHMPEMDGADFLEQIATRFPSTARLVLSGYAEEAIARKAAHFAHRYLSKPTNVPDLIVAVDQAAAWQRTICNRALHQALTSCKTLPTPPALYTQIVAATQSETTDVGEIAKLVEKDISLSAKLLQLINSSFFGIGRRISLVEQAISLLGMVRLRGLLLAEEIFRKFDSHGLLPESSLTALWRHAALVSETSMRISLLEKQTGDRPEQAYTAGLLHDLGILFLAAQSPEAFVAIREEAARGESSVWQIESRVLGVTHADLGGALLSLWGLPPRIVEGVTYHHGPTQSDYGGLCAVSTVHAADAFVSQLLGYDGLPQFSACLPVLDEQHLANIGMAPRKESWEAIAVQACATELEHVP